MAGTVLGGDQVKKINATFPVLVAHIRELLVKDHTGVGLMRVHTLVESFDSDQMARIFRDLSFISQKEKLALVRAAVYQVMASEPALFVAPDAIVVTGMIAETVLVKPEPAKVFTPAQFNLNVNKTEGFHGQRPADTPKPEPVVTSTHTSKVSVQLEEGKKQAAEQQLRLDAAVAKFREETAPKPIEIMGVPADVNLQATASETLVVEE